jgi:hypothetical protein
MFDGTSFPAAWFCSAVTPLTRRLLVYFDSGAYIRGLGALGRAWVGVFSYAVLTSETASFRTVACQDVPKLSTTPSIIAYPVPAQAVYSPGSWDFRIRSTESIVFQLRVVAGAPKSLSI